MTVLWVRARLIVRTAVCICVDDQIAAGLIDGNLEEDVRSGCEMTECVASADRQLAK